MKIAITGATGFIGRGLTSFLGGEGHQVIALSRNPQQALTILDSKLRTLRWTPDNRAELVHELDGVDAIINLAGENIGSSLWTERKRKRIIESRVSAGRLVTDVVASMTRKPNIVVQASAVGFYGSRSDEVLDETSASGNGFLADVVRVWEDSTRGTEALGVRRVIIRTGVVFGGDGGALPKLALPYKLFLGTLLGSGKQWVPWIYYSDELEAIRFLLTSQLSSGVYNLVSPNPARMEEVCSAIGGALRRPTIIRVPDFFLKMAMGKMAGETILPSQKVIPSRLAEAGFEFRHADLRTSITQIFSQGIGR